MAIDIFHEDMLVKAAHLASIRQAKANWGRALVRTDINNSELDFLARSYQGCVAREQKAKIEARDAAGIVRRLSRQ